MKRTQGPRVMHRGVIDQGVCDPRLRWYPQLVARSLRGRIRRSARRRVRRQTPVSRFASALLSVDSNSGLSVGTDRRLRTGDRRHQGRGTVDPRRLDGLRDRRRQLRQVLRALRRGVAARRLVLTACLTSRSTCSRRWPGSRASSSSLGLFSPYLRSCDFCDLAVGAPCADISCGRSPARLVTVVATVPLLAMGTPPHISST